MNSNTVNQTLEKEIDELLERSIGAIYPSKEQLKSVLLSGKKLRVYIGADATGPDLHIGHSTNYILLEKFRKLGHEAIILFGDFTAMIGDPTGKDVTRVALNQHQVAENIKTWKRQLQPIVKLSGWSNKAQVVKNSSWLGKLKFEDVVKLASEFTVQQMIERDMFSKRLGENKPIYLNEFLYPLMQGYDSVALDVDLEIGGSDQTFNMLAGRTLLKKYKNKEKFVVTTTLLENPKTGKKLMSKSEGGYISLQDTYQNMFGKTMALPDEVVRNVFIDCTYLSISEIDKIFSGDNPKDAKMRLAFELVKMYHGASAAKKAKENFESTFSKGEIPETIPAIEISRGTLLSEVCVQAGVIKSKSEFGRLVKEGAVFDMEKSQKIDDTFYKVERDLVLRLGKHRFIKILVK